MTQPQHNEYGNPRTDQYNAPVVAPKKKRGIFKWVFLAINLLFLVWIISGASSASDNCDGEVGQALEACQAGTAVGAGIGVLLIVFLWVAVDVILGIGYLIFRKK